MHLSALAKELEMTGRSGILEGAKGAAQKLQEEFGLAVKALEDVIARSGLEQKPR
jgi:hypothetical protein